MVQAVCCIKRLCRLLLLLFSPCRLQHDLVCLSECVLAHQLHNLVELILLLKHLPVCVGVGGGGCGWWGGAQAQCVIGKRGEERERESCVSN